MIQLSKRMNMLARLAPEGGILADIGTDHGYLPIALMQEGHISGAIAMDINKGPLMRAKAHIREAGLASYIETRRSDGLEKLEPGEADTILIAGMGGPLMADILEKKLPVAAASVLVLQPQSDFYGFRDYLCRRGFAIKQEAMTEDGGKFYTAMVCRMEKPYSLTDREKYFGPVLLKKRPGVFLDFVRREIGLWTPVIARLEEQIEKGGASPRIIQRKEQLTQYVKYGEEVLAE